ncbi:MAG: radical SAM family heme chaperone HemW [Verrucomicrobiia bacterium]
MTVTDCGALEGLVPAEAGAGSPTVQHLYVHIPFCLRKCPYCAFYSVPFSSELVGHYVEMLVKEMEMVVPALAPKTVYFGGGTPSLLSEKHFEKLVAVFQRAGWTDIGEWTVEANPATLTLDKARFLRQLGVNRVSLGVQSLDETVLKRLGRVHTRADALRSFDILRGAGFTNINIDLMFAVPGQTLSAWEKVLEEALALGSEHLSAYELNYEQDTPFFEEFAAGKFESEEDLGCEMYELLLGATAARGFVQYEVSNFARDTLDGTGAPPAFACRHNISYWRGRWYYGLGPSAASYVMGVRYANFADLGRYCRVLASGHRPIASAERLSPLARAGETAAFGLRMSVGWSFEEFRRVTGFDLRDEWAEEIADFVEGGYAEMTSSRFKLTPKGMLFADLVGERFLRPEY